ncbi:MAG: ABC transporter ATP-binding protein/permease [Oscillospiraceae bacterium]|nr:ABC transporter ATP-binding protein/permease [Oscillospiraceae bacterium]
MSQKPENKDKYTIKEGQGPKPQGGPGPRGFGKPKELKKTVKRILSYLSESKLSLVVVFVCLIGTTVTNLYGTYMLRPIINNLVGEGDVETKLKKLLSSIILLLIVYLLCAVFQYFQSATMAKVALRSANKLRSDLFSALERQPLKYFDAHPHGELMSRFTNDADNVSLAMEQSLVNLVSSVLTFVGVIAMMLITCPPLFIVTVLVCFASMMVFKTFGGKSRIYFKKQQRALGQLNGNIQETIEGLKVVKAFTHEKASNEEFDRLNKEFREAAATASFNSGIIMPISMTLNNAGYALTAIVGGFLAIVRGFDLGGFAAYLMYAKQVGRPIMQISQEATSVLSALAGAERIFEVMDSEPEIDEGKVTLVSLDGYGKEIDNERNAASKAWKKPLPDGSFEYIPVKGEVVLKNVFFSYVEGKPVLKDISVSAKPGQKIAFVGSTGAGKTTVTNLINRFYETNSGLITYDGIDIREIEKDSLRRSLGAVLQDTHLFTGTVMDNIRYGRLDANDEECVIASQTANAHSFVRRLPDGYHTMITGDGANLSQGQRQLLAIARAAVAEPPVMVLDEATSSIDTRTERHIQQGMDALMLGRTVFIIAHRLSTVRSADCIVVIENGEICEMGNHEELLRQEGRYYRLYTGQNILS